MTDPEPYPLVEVTGEDIIVCSNQILEATKENRPETVITSLVLLAYALLREEAISAAEGQRVLNEFTSFALAGKEGLQ